MRRRGKRLLSVLAAALVAAGCGGAQPPAVTFAAGAGSVVARPTQYCDLALADCTADNAAPVDLAVPVGTALQVTVPDEIASTPWQVVFTYLGADGTRTDGRSPVFAATTQHAYRLELPAPTDRLLGAQVQQYGPPPQNDPATGELVFPIRASWVLRATAA